MRGRGRDGYGPYNSHQTDVDSGGRSKSRGILALEKSTDGWDAETVEPLWLAFEEQCVRNLLDLRAERYVREVVGRLETEMGGMGLVSRV